MAGSETFEVDAKQPISVLSILLAIRQGYRTVIASTILFFIASALYLHIVPGRYTVSLALAPVNQSSSAASGGLSSLTSLIGANKNSGSENQYSLFVEAIQKRQIVAEGLMHDPVILHEMFPEEWSATEQRWVHHDSAASQIKASIMGILGLPVQPWTPPDENRVMNYLQNYTVEENRESPIITLNVTVLDKEFGARLILSIRRVVDDYLKQRVLQRADNYIHYIQAELQTVTSVEDRQSLVDLLEQQEKLRMASSSSLPFVAEPFGNVVVPSVSNSPDGKITLLLGAVLGALVGCGLTLLPASLFRHAKDLVPHRVRGPFGHAITRS